MGKPGAASQISEESDGAAAKNEPLTKTSASVTRKLATSTSTRFGSDGVPPPTQEAAGGPAVFCEIWIWSVSSPPQDPTTPTIPQPMKSEERLPSASRLPEKIST